MRSPTLLTAVVAVVVLAACSSDAEDSAGPNNPADDGVSAPGDPIESTGEPDWEGAPLNPFDLRAGECFNEVSWIDEQQNRRIEITAAVDCSRPHDKEVYHEAEFPAPNGAPYPGDGAMSAWSTEVCYEAFEPFVRLEYELSVYGIDFLQPTQATFEHPVGRHRRVTCFLYSTADDKLVGSARNSGA